ncbi:MAG: formyltransferase family protein [Haloarcula sp.]
MGLTVAVVTQDEPFYMPTFYRSFLDALDGSITVEWVTILSTFDESLPDLVRRGYQLYGPAGFVRRGIGYAARTAADRAEIGSYSVESVVRRRGVEVEHCGSVNTDAFRDRVEEAGVDVLLSVSAPEVFEPATLAAPRWGCLNVHTSELPKYRGMLPTFWALYHDEDEVGVTVHTMTETIDDGEIVRQTAFQVPEDATLDDVITRGKRAGGRLAAEALADVNTEAVTLTPMEGEESYFSFPSADERREFQRRGNRLL